MAAVAVSSGVALALVRRPSADTAATTWTNLLLAATIPVVVVLSFTLVGLYKRVPERLLTSSFSELRESIYALALAMWVVVGIEYALTATRGDASVSFDPATIIVALPLAVVAVNVGRALARQFLRSSGAVSCRVLLVGSGTMVAHVAKYLSWDSRITVVGFVDDDPAPGTTVLGRFDQLPAIVDEFSIDEVIVGFSRTHPQEAVLKLQSLRPSVGVSIVPRYFELLSWRSTVKDVAGLPLIDVAPPSLGSFARVTKRTLDVVLATVALVVLSPVLVASAVAIKVSSRGPVLFRQERTGRDGTKFEILKLRTMEVDAETRKDPAATDSGANQLLFKMEEDPRVTPVGRHLRRLSIDELPQLVNVLKGEMSLVGPRPFVPEESAHLDGATARRFEVRPGMTGLWQVSGRSDLSEEELRRLDYLYVASWSPWWDLRILWQTPVQVLKGRGAF